MTFLSSPFYTGKSRVIYFVSFVPHESPPRTRLLIFPSFTHSLLYCLLPITVSFSFSLFPIYSLLATAFSTHLLIHFLLVCVIASASSLDFVLRSNLIFFHTPYPIHYALNSCQRLYPLNPSLPIKGTNTQSIDGFILILPSIFSIICNL